MEPFAPEELVRRCQRTLPHDTRAFEQLVTLYKERLFATAYRIIGNRHDAEDVAQEVFLKVYRGIRTLDEPATLTSWIYRITSNTCMDALARQKRRSDIPLTPEDEAGQETVIYEDTRTMTPEQAALRNELRLCLQEALEKIDAGSRVAIVLRDIEDRPYQEIAESLKLGLSAVKMRIHRARLAFQQMLLSVCPDAWQQGAIPG